MATKIDIASNALVLIGDNTINSFEDTGAGAKAANALYDIEYEAMLTEHRWTFAQNKAVLSRLTAAPENTWQYAFQIPTNLNLLMVFGVYPDSPYDIYGDEIYSNNTTCEIDYIYKVDESKLPSAFVNALQMRLASKFAVFIADDNTMAEVYAGQAHEALNVAKRIDSQSRTTQRIKSAPFLAVR